MKIVYLHQYFNTPEMSGGTRSFEMARRLVDAGHEVHMITSARDDTLEGSQWRLTKEAGINVHWYPVPYSNRMTYVRRIMAFFAFAMASTRKAIAVGGDLVFASSTPLTIAVPGVIASKWHKIPMVFEVRDLWPEMPIAIGALKGLIPIFMARWLERWAYRNSASIVALSPGMKDGVVRTGFPKERVAVIPNGCDEWDEHAYKQLGLTFRAERDWLGSGPLLIYAGTFGKVNNVGYLVDIAVELEKSGSSVQILCVGDGAEKTAIIDKAARKSVLDVNIHFEPAIPKSKMPGLMSAATMTTNLVIDIPEARANSANKFFDSLAAGKPIFINHAGWMQDMIVKHGCGLAGWGSTADEVASLLDQKLTDPMWLDEASSSAKQLAFQYFDRDALAAQLENVLSLAGSSPSSASSIAPGSY